MFAVVILTTFPGHVFGGASLPYAMVKPVADSLSGNRGGFQTDDPFVTGFSHMHDTGTGGGSSMGNFPLWPMSHCAGNSPDGCAPFDKKGRSKPWKRSSVIRGVGYFSIELSNNITTEMTSSEHTALYRFNYPDSSHDDPATAEQIFVLADLTDLYDSRANGRMIVNLTTGRITAEGNYMSSFGNSGRYRSYACIDFFGAPLTSAGVWQGDVTYPLTNNITVGGFNTVAGAYVQFSRPDGVDSLLARVGQSWISPDRACDHAEREIPTFDFASLVEIQSSTWKSKLDVIKVDPIGVTDDLQAAFWSGLYRNFISPQNMTGENPLWKSEEPYYDSFYCIWDSFRAQFPLLTIIDPYPLEEMIRSLIDTYEHTGYLPDCHMQLDKGVTQGGSNAEVVIADWAVKMGLTPAINWTRAYAGMIKDAEVEPIFSALVEGRSHAEAYNEYGFIPHNDILRGNGLRGAEISRTVEYAYDDFCIATVAHLMNTTHYTTMHPSNLTEETLQADYKKYLARSYNYRNHFNPNTSSTLHNKDTTFTGFHQPRLANGTFIYQDPALGSPAVPDNSHFSQSIATYEGSSWQYTLYAPGDNAGLITLLGGSDDEFVRRLDFLHDHQLFDIGNEPGMHHVFQYHYAGRPGKSSARTRFYIPRLFNSTLTGMPGNDDSGSMGAFVVFSMLGLWPVAGQNVYLITAPFFRESSVTSPVTGNTARIIAHNFDERGDSEAKNEPTGRSKNIYIQKATLNGKTYARSWLDHSFFLEGGMLELWLGEEEEGNVWGRRQEDRPPSLSKEGIWYGEKEGFLA